MHIIDIKVLEPLDRSGNNSSGDKAEDSAAPAKTQVKFNTTIIAAAPNKTKAAFNIQKCINEHIAEKVIGL
ncbi:hypothetical protein NMY22_g10188 [Coprinellus aureogranulatus]|nr:hypothetical protein NMY22_g10188 [Coprinellus aureogranulatus]